MIAIFPDQCPEQDIHTLIWPGDDGSPIQPYARKEGYPYIYVKDDFLKKYEENDEVYTVIPEVNNPDNIFDCSPQYKGQWSFVGLRRIGRNLIQLSSWDLHRMSVPLEESLYLHSHAISPAEADALGLNGEHIVKKTKVLVEEILRLGNLFFRLAYALDLHPRKVKDYVGLDPQDINNNGWHNSPMLCKLARVASLNMSKAEFLSRYKTLHEFLKYIKPPYLKEFLNNAGVDNERIKEHGNITLLQSITNLLDFLVDNSWSVSSWKNSAHLFEWNKKNPSLAPLFINNDLRQMDAHVKSNKSIPSLLQGLGFDSATLLSGYGTALDFIFDQVTNAIKSINDKLSTVLE